jgi:hypothetical protein
MLKANLWPMEQFFVEFARRCDAFCNRSRETEQDGRILASVQAAGRMDIDMASGKTAPLKLFSQGQDDRGCTAGTA